MQTLVEQFFAKHGKLISDGDLGTMLAWEFPINIVLTQYADELKDSFYTAQLAEDVTELGDVYLCYMVRDNDKIGVDYHKVFKIHNAINSAFERRGSFLETLVQVLNKFGDEEMGDVNRRMYVRKFTDYYHPEPQIYCGVLLRAIWIDKILGYNNNV